MISSMNDTCPSKALRMGLRPERFIDKSPNCVIPAVIGLIKAASGEYRRLPVFGAYAERIKF
jgi:hypothetical protein